MRLNKKKIILTILILSFLTPILHVPTIKAASSTFTEDFENSSYKDAPNTNVTGWDTGNIYLPRKTFTDVGACDTYEAMRLCVQGNFAYIADLQEGLKIINITDPTAPVLVGNYSISLDAWDVAVVGDHAFVASNLEGLTIYNVSDPTNPTFSGSCKLSSLDFRRVVVSGDYAYVIGGGRFAVIDISNLTSPQIVYWIINPNTYSLAVSGNYAYTSLSQGVSGQFLRIFNITYPKSPTIVLNFNTTPYVFRDMEISGNYLYATITNRRFTVIDIKDPASPLHVSEIALARYPQGLAISGDYAYIGHEMEGMTAIDISDPYTPILLQSINTPHATYDCAVSGNYVYIVDATTGLHAIQVSDPTNPSLVGTSSTNNETHEVFVEGNFAYVADGSEGLQVFNISNPINPTHAGGYNLTGFATGVSVSGDYAYVAGTGLTVVDISEPISPSYAGSYSSPGGANDLWVEGDNLYIADLTEGLRVVNITEPQNPASIGAYNTSGVALAVTVSGNYAYVADNESLQIVDVTDPTNPLPAFMYNTTNGGGVYDVSVAGDFAFVCTGIQGIEVVSITNPRNSSYSGSLAVPCHDIFLDGDIAYTTTEDSNKFYVINITDPSNPTLMYTYNLSLSQNWDVIVVADYAYVSGHNTTDSTIQVVEVNLHRTRQFATLAVAQSNRVYSGSSSLSLKSANLTAIDSIPPGTSIEYYLSPDDGLNWEQVIPSLEHTFSNTGYQLKWKAILSSADPLASPSISNISIKFTTVLNAPSLLTPVNATHTNDTTPTLTWTSISGATSYIIELDTIETFDSPNFINDTSFSPSFTPISALNEGLWCWRVIANDSEGDLGYFSGIQWIMIDSVSPTIGTPTADIVYTLGDINQIITWNISDLHPASYVIRQNTFVADSDNWNGSSLSIDVAGLSVGTYNYTCTVYDEAGNRFTDSVKVEVQEESGGSGIPFGNLAILLTVITTVSLIIYVKRLLEFKNKN